MTEQFSDLRQTVTVSALNQYIKYMFESSDLLCRLSVRGEISNLTLHRSGHIYFSLKDEGGLIRAVMFRSSASQLRFMPSEGMKIVATGSVSVYTKDGQYQLYVNRMEPDGLGALYLAFEQLKEKLRKEGLFDESRKKPIPRFPEKVAVITSATGAAVHDMINVMSRRWPLTHICIFPSEVQGAKAAPSLISALDTVEHEYPCDVIIIGRGGGSMEDLWAFNDEALARRISSCSIPVISAVGHESDFTICDFAADFRAPTPSAAAELVVCDAAEVGQRLVMLSCAAYRAAFHITDTRSQQLKRIASAPVFRFPHRMFSERKLQLDTLNTALDAACDRINTSKSSQLERISAQLEALSPLKTLSRGYAIVSAEDGTVIRCGEAAQTAGTINIRFSDKTVRAEVKDKA